MNRLLLCMFSVVVLGVQAQTEPIPPTDQADGELVVVNLDSEYLDRLEKKADAAKHQSLSMSRHRLSENDVIEVKVYQEEDLNSRARVDADGNISMPLLGLVKVGGKTVAEAQQMIRDRLAEDYLHNPQVTLGVLEFAKRRFSIMGEVAQPGFYTFPDGEPTTLLQAVAIAGGFTPFARSGKVTIRRTVGAETKVFQVNAKDMSTKAQAQTLQIEPGDAIVVHSSIF